MVGEGFEFVVFRLPKKAYMTQKVKTKILTHASRQDSVLSSYYQSLPSYLHINLASLPPERGETGSYADNSDSNKVLSHQCFF